VGVRVKVTGVEELRAALAEMTRRIEDTEIVAEEIAEDMREEVPVDTGHLRSTIYSRAATAGASAPYAGYVAEYVDYPGMAIKTFDLDRWLDYVMEPF
jgi:hypothetical protein